MVKTYIRIWYPGSFVSENAVKEVGKREELPDIGRGYGWQYFEREYVNKDGEELLGPAKNKSQTFYLGEEYSADAAKHLGNDIMRSNIEGNGYKRMVKTKYGQWFPLDDTDEVISHQGKLP